MVNPDARVHQLLSLSCPICTQTSYRLFRKSNYWVRACDACGHQFAEYVPPPDHVRQVFDGQYFQGDGGGYVDYLAGAIGLRRQGQRYAQLLEFYLWPGRVLDVGAAAGFMLQGLMDRGWRGEGLEPNDRLADYGRQRLGLNMVTGTLEDYVSRRSFDLVCMIQVIANFYDLKQALKVASAVTKPQGFWLVETWNRQSLTAHLWGKHWRAYDLPSVLRWFSPADLRCLAEQFGFKEIVRGKPTQWINGTCLKTRLRYRLMDLGWVRPPAKILNLVPDYQRLPCRAEDRFWVLFQKT